MSADAITVCPACYAAALGRPFREVIAEDLQWTRLVTNQLREFHECYIENGAVHFVFSATCRECGYHVESMTLSAPLPEPA